MQLVTVTSTLFCFFLTWCWLTVGLFSIYALNWFCCFLFCFFLVWDFLLCLFCVFFFWGGGGEGVGVFLLLFFFFTLIFLSTHLFNNSVCPFSFTFLYHSIILSFSNGRHLQLVTVTDTLFIINSSSMYSSNTC